ncbi:MAG TPA: hypothetical protein VIG28_08100 [Leifsonia sp.]
MSVPVEARPSGARVRFVALSVVLPAVVYLALACILYWPVSPLSATRLVGDCACGDAVQQAWFMDWVAFALGHGQNPLFTTYLNAPSGANLGVNTSMPLIGLLGGPVTWLRNSIAAFNLLLRVSLAISAFSMYLVLRRYVRSGGAAFVGGLLFGFSPYMLAEARLHVFLVFLPLLPPLILLIDRWLIRADGNPYRCGALIGLLMGLEMLISAELVVVFVILAIIALIPIAIRHRRQLRSRLPLLLRGAAAATVVGLVVGGYVAYMFIAGPQRPQGPPHSVANLDSYHSDLLSLFVPSRPQLIRPALFHRGAQHFVKGSLNENGFYLGIPLLAVLIAGSVWLRRNTLVLSFATLGVVSFVLSLGTHLTVANRVTAIPLPIAAVTGIPMLQEIGPTRFALPIQLVASVLLALVLDAVVQRFALRGWRRPAVLSAISVVVLIPLLPNGFIPSVPAPPSRYFASSSVKEIPQGSTVLPYPYAYYTSNESMLWQIASDMRFRMPGGEVYVPGPNHKSTNYPRGDLSPALWAVLVKAPSKGAGQWQEPSAAHRTELVSALRTYVASHGIDTMVVSANDAQGRWVKALTESAFGSPTSVHGDVSVWLKPVS